MQWLAAYVDKMPSIDRCRNYYRQWQFKHPQPQDLKKVFEVVTGKPDSAFALLDQKGYLPGKEPKGTRFWKPLETAFFGKDHDKKCDRRTARYWLQCLR
mgnify:CR=1 FL=1